MSPDFAVYAWGLCAASVCTALGDDETTLRLNRELPTGIESRWGIAADESFRDGTPNPAPCHDHPSTHRHLLFRC